MSLKPEEVLTFFDEFEMEEDRHQGHSYTAYLKNAVGDFLKDSRKASAFEVYRVFLDSYRNRLQGGGEFVDLMDVLSRYEETAVTLLEKGRDHYVHSVNVFALGLQIYARNQSCRESFRQFADRNPYLGSFECAEEEFLFQWGLASMFHDTGYPVEITNNQIRQFMQYLSKNEPERNTEPFIGYHHFERLLSGYGNVMPHRLLAQCIGSHFDLDAESIEKSLEQMVEKMQKSGFVDHGYYSALILLNWYGKTMAEGQMAPEIYRGPVVNAATAILMHNYYRMGLQKEPYLAGAMNPDRDPLSYLLILCDELQEWNRTAYGKADKRRILASDVSMEVKEELLSVHYIASGAMQKGFSEKKKSLLEQTLQIPAWFSKGIVVTTSDNVEDFVHALQEQELLPRPAIEHIELLARQIHEAYRQKQLQKGNKEVPVWEELADTLKYSNFRQARDAFERPRQLGYCVLEKEVGIKAGKQEMLSFTPGEIEYLARIEHDSWMEERIRNGWRYGEVKDVDKKLSPYLVPYEELEESIKQLDRDAVSNVIVLLSQTGFGVFQDS